MRTTTTYAGLFILAVILAIFTIPNAAKVDAQSQQGNESITVAPKGQQDYKALISALPVRDRRDVGDRAYIKARLEAANYQDEYIYKELSAPRLKLADKELAIDGEWSIIFTIEVNAENFAQEAKRIQDQYGVAVFQELKSDPTFGVHLRGTVEQAIRLSTDLMIRDATQNYRMKDAGIPQVVHRDFEPAPMMKGKTATACDWGVNMISNRNMSQAGCLSSFSTGLGTDAYVLGTGIANNAQTSAHFNGHVNILYDTGNPQGQDLYPHETLVAYILGSALDGVAKQALMWNGRYGYNPPAAFISALDIETVLVQAKITINQRRPRFGVVQIALIFPSPSTGMNTYLTDLINIEVPIICAAGQHNTVNGWTDARSAWWPGSVNGTTTIGMVNSDKRKTTGATDGYCASHPDPALTQNKGVDLFASAGFKRDAFGTCIQPGINVLFNNGTFVWSAGSSLASPMAAGVAAGWGAINQTFWPEGWMIKKVLQDTATDGQLSGLGTGDQNKFLYTNAKAIKCLNAASYAEGLARNAYSVCYGAFGSTVVDWVEFKSSPAAGNTIGTPVFASQYSGQVTIVTPSTTAEGGPQYLRVYEPGIANNDLWYGFAYIHDVAPGIFSFNGTGSGPGSIQAWKYAKGHGALLSIEDNTPAGITWNSATEDIILVVYGTGFNSGSGAQMALRRNSVDNFINTTYCCNGGPLNQVNSGWLDDTNKAVLDGGFTWTVRTNISGKQANDVTIKIN